MEAFLICQMHCAKCELHCSVTLSRKVHPITGVCTQFISCQLEIRNIIARHSDNVNSFVPSFQHHLNIMQSSSSTYKLQTPDYTKVILEFYKVRGLQFLSWWTWLHNIQIMLKWWDKRIDIVSVSGYNVPYLKLTGYKLGAYTRVARILHNAFDILKKASPFLFFV